MAHPRRRRRSPPSSRGEISCDAAPSAEAAAPGKYALAGTVFDPLDLASKYDVNWLREAELKCAASAACAPLQVAQEAAAAPHHTAGAAA
eukprot:4281702-Prymnesium_polylepis.1